MACMHWSRIVSDREFSFFASAPKVDSNVNCPSTNCLICFELSGRRCEWLCKRGILQNWQSTRSILLTLHEEVINYFRAPGSYFMLVSRFIILHTIFDSSDRGVLSLHNCTNIIFSKETSFPSVPLCSRQKTHSSTLQTFGPVYILFLQN